MKVLPIELKSFQDVWTVSRLAAHEKFRISISDGRLNINAKSLMCLFSLNLSRELELQLDCSDEELKQFCIRAARFVSVSN